MWNMQEVAEANARGEDKHPDRTNVTDAFVDLIQPLYVPLTGCSSFKVIYCSIIEFCSPD